MDKSDFAKRLANKLIEQLKAGTAPWQQPRSWITQGNRSKMGIFQQRYVKRHETWHNPDMHNEIRLFAAPKIRPLSGR